MNIKVVGYKNLEKHLKFHLNPEKKFDKVIKKHARQSLSVLIRKTNVDEGNTHRSWQTPVKIKDSLYKVSNDAKTEDKKHFIVNILNYGRKEVFPKPTNKYGLLYIPIGPTRIGRKKLGSAIPKGAVYGKHYIFAKKVKSFKGTKFITKEIKNRTKKLKNDIVKLLKKKLNG